LPGHYTPSPVLEQPQHRPAISAPKGRPHHRHSERRGADHDSHRHSERRGAKQSEAPRIKEPVLQRREATPFLLLWHGVRWPEINVHAYWRVCCGFAPSTLWRDQRSPLSKRMLWLGVGCLVEALFKRVPPLRAFGPPVGMTAKGGLQNRRVGCAARGMGFATEDTEGTEGIRPQVGSVVSVILCGLSCPCGLFILSVVVCRVAPSSSFRATRCEAERSTADRGTRSSASRSDTAFVVAS